MTRRFLSGITLFFDSLLFLFNNRLIRYAVLPGMLGLLVGVFLTVGIYHGLSSWLLGFVGDGDSWWTTALVWVVQAGSGLLALILFIILYRAVISIVVIPFLGPMLERVEKILLGHPIKTTLAEDFVNALKGVISGLRYFLVEFSLFIVTLALGPFQVLVMVLVSGYFLGRSAFDYILEKHYRSFSERARQARNYRMELAGIGVGTWLFLLIPVIGIVFASAVSVIAAARLFYPDHVGTTGSGTGREIPGEPCG